MSCSESVAGPRIETERSGRCGDQVRMRLLAARVCAYDPDRVVRSASSQGAPRRYNICTDIQFDTVENVVIAMFELPGVKKTDVRISIATCPFSRVKQLTVSGTSRSALGTERGHTIRERKFGDFSKSIGVPPETQVRGAVSQWTTIAEAVARQPRDVHAIMEDGVLTLRIPGGQPTQAFQPQDVPLV